MEHQTHEVTQERREALKSKIQIYDMDAHVIETDDDLRPLMPEPYRNKQGSLLGMDEWHVRVRRRPRAPDDLEKRLAVMKEEGIVYSLLFPSRAMDVGTQRDKHFAGAFCRAYNDYIASVCREASRLKGVALLPFQDVPAAVAELKRAVTKLELSGVVLSSFGLKEHIGSSTFWPIYEEMERLNVPLLIHNLSYQGPGQDLRADSFLFQDTVGGSMETFHTCTALMYGGIPDKFPKLRIGVFNTGIGWVPFLMERMDKDFKGRNKEEAPLLQKAPSAHVTGGNWYFATTDNEQSLPYVLETVGEDQIIFGSAYPEADSLFPEAVSSIRARTDVSDQAKKKILGENAKGLFGWA